MNEADAVDALIGRVIGDAYVIQDLLGVGGMGRVYRAEQRALGRVVAIKVVHMHLLGDRDSVSRFYTEARAASSLNHPNSVSIFDFGRTDDGMLYLVMEYLRGKDLAQVMHEQGPLQIARVVDIALGVLGALGEAHARGVVHRDLKPENIILEQLRGGGDLVKVVDFGLAQIRGVEPAEAARGLVAGTPDYMAPEQARALEVDGRGDLYALGVMLFELLTGRLPFVADSPSKVMLAHVVEPVPNPHDVAPYRGLPDALVHVILRALQKEAADRYQDADEMAGDLRQVASALKSQRERVRCPRCGAQTEAQRAFCGDCGMRMMSLRPAPGSAQFSLPPVGEGSLVGRDALFDDLLATLRAAEGRERIAYLVGELGIGKTRLLTELATHAEREGYLVVESGPHESGAPVPYAAIRRAVARLLNVTDQRLAVLAEDGSLWRDRVARAGIRELVQPEGLPGHEGVSRAEAVAVALARAVALAKSRAGLGRVLLVFDDLMRCDGLTAEVLAAFAQHVSSLPVFVVVSDQAPPLLASRWPGPMYELSGLDQAFVGEFVRSDIELPPAVLGGALPLHLEQLRAIAWEPTVDEPEPPSLWEALTRRLAPLDVAARRVLQAFAVLGERASREALAELVERQDLRGLDGLVERGFLRHQDDEFVFAHPYVRDVVEASTPAETRKLLHARALDYASSQGQPLEVRAEHAARAGDAVTALMLLERMGKEALKRGDPTVGVVAFRQGLELARRELLESGDEALDRAIVTFSRQLAEALVWSGDATGAAGVLNEALALAGPASVERARMMLALGRVAERRERPAEAARKLALAADMANAMENRELEARALWALSRVRRAQGDGIGATNALTLGVLASIDELRGEPQAALAHYREACVLAADAGDIRSRDRWGRAAQALAG